MFHVGQKVVCIADKWTDDPKPGVDVWPQKGMVYTIRSLEQGEGVRLDRWYLRLNEIVNPLHLYRRGISEASFLADRFRPVRETDIRIFTAMLAPQPKEPANA